MRILFVAFQNSVHTARWIRQFTDQGWDIHIFPSTLQGEPHPLLLQGKVKTHFPRLLRLVLRVLRRWAQEQESERAHRWFASDVSAVGAWWLTSLIRLIRPDIVHSLEIQHSGYLTLEAKKCLGPKMPAWIVGNWGSDIYLFGQLPSHVERIREVLQQCDYYTCECERDVRLALDLGLRAKSLPVLPNAGGFNLDTIARLRAPGKTSSRRIVLLKGYQGWVGRALVGLKAVELCADELRGYQLLIPLASPEVQLAAELLAHRTGLSIEVMPERSHEEMLKVFGKARVYIGLSISDAISQSMLEALVMGAFPIQSSTACVDEWLSDGVNGLVVPPEDPSAVAIALQKALASDELVDSAAEVNWALAQERLDMKLIQPKAISMYERVLQEKSIGHN